jgi:hypothetical protein
MMMSDLVERLRKRTLVHHGGESKYGWNLTEGDSELHVEAATEIEALRSQLAHWKVFAEHAEAERSRLKLLLDRECSDADAILTALGMTADLYRTDGGSLHMPRILGCLAGPQNAVQAAYGGLTQTAQG